MHMLSILGIFVLVLKINTALKKEREKEVEITDDKAFLFYTKTSYSIKRLNKKNKHYPFHIGTVSTKVHGVGETSREK